MPVSEQNGQGIAGSAYRSIRAAILEGRLKPGTPLSRRRLAEEYGASTVPVGDALARLGAEGLVESRPRAGTRVRLASADEIHGNYVLREALETHSARLFAEAAAPRERRRLLVAADRLDRAYNAFADRQDYDPERHSRIERMHLAFHMLIAEAAGVPVLTAAIERSRVLLFNSIFTVSSEFNRLPDRWHRDLASLLCSGTPEEAAEAMRVHVRYRQEQVIEKFAQLAAEQPRMVRGPQRKRN